MNQPLRPLLCALAAAGLLSACGGGGPDEDPSAAAAATPADAAERRQILATAGPFSAPVKARYPEVLVMLKPDGAIQPLLAKYKLVVLTQFGARPIWRLRAPAGAQVGPLVDALRGETTVRFAEPNREVAAPEASNASVWAVGGDAGVYASQYAPQHLDLPGAHALAQGEGVRVAVLDTGADLTHPVLAPRWARTAQGVLLGRDFVQGDADPSEPATLGQPGFGHGTHVAGLVALAAPAARLMPVRVLGSGGEGNAWVLAEAVMWALDPDGDPLTDDGAHVINLSLGSLVPTDLLKLVTELATCRFDDDDDVAVGPGFVADRARCEAGHGAVVVAAGGNGGNDQDKVYPGAEAVKGSIAVAATTAQRTLASFSNWGSWIGIAAPGQQIVSTVPGGGWGVWSGTSMATPLVAGTAALVLSTLPSGGNSQLPAPRQWNTEQVLKRLTDRPIKLCGTSFLQVHAQGAVTDTTPADPACP